MTERRRPFASASRTRPVQKRVRDKRTPDSPSAKSGLVNTAGGRGSPGGGGAVLVLQVWESTDRLRRMIMQQVGHRRWQCLRLQRETVETPWEPTAGLVVNATTHARISQAHGRMRAWLVYGR